MNGKITLIGSAFNTKNDNLDYNFKTHYNGLRSLVLFTARELNTNITVF